MAGLFSFRCCQRQKAAQIPVCAIEAEEKRESKDCGGSPFHFCDGASDGVTIIERLETGKKVSFMS
jgi:hypothetical protein